VLAMMWQCDVCHMGNICDASSETHLFAVIRMAERDHESLSPSCELDAMKIHGWLFQPLPGLPSSGR
jgi:hypothetical protein